MDHAEFPSSDTLAAFIDGQLDEATRREVMSHAAGCDECYATLEAVQAWRKNEAPPAAVVRPQFGGKRWIAALAVAAAAAFAVFLTPDARDWMAVRGLRNAASVRALRGVNELPLTGIAYRPAPESKRGAGEDKKDASPKVLAAAADVEDRAAAHKTPRNERALGLAHLVTGDPPHAFEHLSAALGVDNGDVAGALARCSDATLASDFGAAAYAKGDYRLARDAYRRALSIDSHYAPAQFGLAKTLEALGQPEEAKAAWNRYLKLDSSPGWADEARAALKPPE